MRKIKNIYHRIRAVIAQVYFGFPSKKLKVIGITGTDGKTTTCFYLYNILKAAGYKVAVVTTIEARFGDEVVDTGLHVTNPDAWKLRQLLWRIVYNGMEYAILEVTSHGIDQGRVYGIKFDVTGLTNITHEHLDYHGTFEKYKKTKMDFVHSGKSSFVSDDVPDSILEGVEVKMPGDYNRKNAKLAAAIAKDLGASNDAVKTGIEAMTFLPGRMQVVYDSEFKVIIDFAHTPNGLESLLTSVREMAASKDGRVITVFGSAGKRDVSKRPLMGEVVGKLSDLAVITAEDPRNESVRDISEQIATGALKLGKVKDEDLFLISDRKEAINFAVNNLAQPNDIVVVAGKGHEKSMNYGQGEEPWDDVEVVKEVLELKS
ncbi:UDP-N-acetylmuramoyl-L-alanyl-D-glutamate--2,6-diaminopimelate ligase [candidate division WWE3 bacterium]|uniref:UDP-N-acetylmuramoyl-L-alanyl-D-glutamate--2, 6-diaminopimelate ligase n=1 Tax=candidate division WWE3 bacterium TaxID=2053526 RepID=A0A955LKH3_UNCKA|nr:UDP-N-acetylmuramoyl-L-alanyl-D-glutamate--2,6-diaminopimelate ligase [candidate division WWE3 bacterium]